MNERSDSDLLRDYAENGSESAFAELVSRHIALVYSVALRVIVDVHLAEDVTQATFAILARNARHLAKRDFLSSWLHRTASNQAAKLVRGEMRRRAREQEAYAMQTSDSEPDWQQIAPLLDGALNRLADSDRTLVLLRFFERKTANEISLALKISQEAAQKRVHRALERLRGILAAGGMPISTTALATLVASQAVGAVPAGLSGSVSAVALAGSVTASGLTISSLKIIVMSKLKTSAAVALVAASVATPIILQHRTVRRLHEENQSLREQVRQDNSVRAENETSAKQLAEAAKSEGLSKGQLTELLRLRSEVGPLRRDSQELARRRMAEQAKQSGPPAEPPGVASDFLPAAAWANVGADKPEAAIQTVFWAGKHQETNLISNLFRWQVDSEIPASDELDEKFANGLVGGATRFFGSLQGFRITSQSEERDNQVRMSVELTNKEGKPESHNLQLVREDNQWFPVMNVWLHDKGSVRAAMDVPPKFETGR